MKREIIAATLLLTILGLCIFNVLYMGRKTAVLTDEIEKAQALFLDGDRAGAAAHVESSLQGWLGWESYSHIMLRHSEIDSLTDAYYLLLDKVQSGTVVPEAAFGALTEKLRDIAVKEGISVGALF